MPNYRISKEYKTQKSIYYLITILNPPWEEVFLLVQNMEPAITKGLIS